MRQAVRVAIIGAGLGGLAAASELIAAGEDDFLIMERSDGVGGVWRANTYPGCACDIPSHLYALRTAPHPQWGRSFSGADEILSYCQRLASGAGIAPRLRTSCTVDRATWDGDLNIWRLETSAGPIEAQILVDATGGLVEPKTPDGLTFDRFDGTVLHTAAWDHRVDLSDRDVAVIGTGASAVQVVPALADTVRRLTVFQRSAPWVLPKADRATGRMEQWLLSRVPLSESVIRTAQYAVRDFGQYHITRRPVARRLGEAAGLLHLRISVADPDLRSRLTPNYEIGCKRILLSNDWYRTLSRPDVMVAEAAVDILENSVVDAAGRDYPADVIVLATGFEVADTPMAHHLVGDDGRTLAQHWAEGIRTYRGTTIVGFPNLVRLGGAGTVTGHMSHLWQMESQCRYLVEMLRCLDDHGARAAAVRPQAAESYHRDYAQENRRTAFGSGGCTSWYLDGSGEPFATWPLSARAFRRQLRRFDDESYQLLGRKSPQTLLPSDWLAVEPIRTDGGLPVRRLGAGEPLVLLHAAASDSRLWAPVVPLLVARGFEVFAPDLPGFGAAQDITPVSWEPAGMASEVAATLNALRLESPHVAGCSFGGAVALELARADLVRSCTAFAPPGLATASEHRAALVSLRASAAVVSRLGPVLPFLTASSVGRTALMSQFVARPWRMESDTAHRTVLGLRNVGVPFLLDAGLGRHLPEFESQVAVTVAWGTRDALLPVRQARRAQSVVPGARVVIIPAAGHLSVVDVPSAVAATITATTRRDRTAERCAA